MAALAVLAVTAVPASAAPPEAPETTPAIEISNTTAVLTGVLNPQVFSSAGWYFAYKAGTECTGGSVTKLEPEESVINDKVQAEITGLQQYSHYTFCLVARNAQEEITVGSPLSFTATSVNDEYASEVGTSSAQLNAELNVRGGAASYHFEYGPTEALGSTTPQTEAQYGHADVLAPARIAGLAPYTVYYARVAMESAYGPATGATFTFRTFPTSPTLPDERVLEMVTPPQNDDADIYAPESGGTGSGTAGFDLPTTVPFQVAQNGEAVTYAGDPVAGGAGSGGDNFHAGNQLLAKRTATGWMQEVMSATGRTHSYYEAFSSNLTVGILRAGNGYGETTALLPEAEALNGGYHVLYERNDVTRGERALFTHFDQTESPEPYGFIPQFVGGSSDFSTMVFDANAALIPGAPTESNVYESVDGNLSLVNVLPDGAVEPVARAGGAQEPGTEEEDREFSHAVSFDGSRIFWTGLGSDPNLYMREDGERTIQIDASQAGGSGGGGHFWTASDSGERVFFTDEASAGLTSDTIPGSGANLYEYDIGDGKLTDLTPGGAAEVQGVIGASAEGDYVYFVANGVLAAGASAGDCAPDVAGSRSQLSCNLYVHDAGGTKFIRQLSDRDGTSTTGYYENGGESEKFGDWLESLGRRTAQVSASGTLVFDSERSLTGYRNEGSGEYASEEVYTYDPAAEGGDGELACASCNPSGEPATGTEGGILPVSHDPAEMSRAIASDGSRVFFNSSEALVPQDSNGEQDVYEWERNGSGTCDLPSNCLSLLSGGKSPANSYLIGTSATGDDVFMVTRAQLVSQDANENYDVYDARVGGLRQLASPVCSGSGCQGVPPAPPVFATPASVTFSGVGNFPPAAPMVVKSKAKAKPVKCKKGFVKKKGKCVKRPKSKTKARKTPAKGGK
jgi:hypothetical protein